MSWNVNGARAVAKKGFGEWLEEHRKAQRGGHLIVGLQEVRAQLDQLPPELAEAEGFHAHFVAAERKGYSGVGILSTREPDAVETSLGEERFDAEGRYQLLRFGRLAIANVYFPNGNGKDRSNDRVPYKLDFYRAVFETIQRKRRGGLRVLVMGDFNTAHREIDLARPKQNKKTSGFLPEEREELDRWIRAGWIDTFREFEQGEGLYSWWSQRFGVREKNIGWRLDYVLASPSARKHLDGVLLETAVMGSDHCPVGVDLDTGVLG